MKFVSFYHKETGLLHNTQLTASDDDLVELNTPADYIAIDGHHDPDQYRVDVSTGELVDYQPPQPTINHEWNTDTRRWQLTGAELERKQKRPDALARIAELEAHQHRLVREALLQLMLGQDTKKSYLRLGGIEDEIDSLRPIVNENL